VGTAVVVRILNGLAFLVAESAGWLVYLHMGRVFVLFRFYFCAAKGDVELFFGF